MTESRTYEEPESLAKQEAETELASGDADRMCHALVGVAFHEPDWQWAQEHCLSLAKHKDPQVSGLALTCLGHLARIHGTLDLERVLPVLNKMRSDPEVGGRAQDALDDIETFIPGAFD